MKTLRQIFAAYVLILTLGFSALAGDISTPIAPPTTSAQGEMQNGIAGDMHTTNSEAAGTDDSVAAGVLGWVVDVLSLL